jgi:hypothetical protein
MQGSRRRNYVVLDRKPYFPNEGEGFSETKIFRKSSVEASFCAQVGISSDFDQIFV